MIDHWCVGDMVSESNFRNAGAGVTELWKNINEIKIN